MTDFQLSGSALKLGSSGLNEPVFGGVIVFGITGMTIVYLAFFHDEMDAGIVLKALGIGLVLMAVVAFLWPLRPWPTGG